MFYYRFLVNLHRPFDVILIKFYEKMLHKGLPVLHTEYMHE